MVAKLGWSRSAVSTAYLVGTLAGAAASPTSSPAPVSKMVRDRAWPRWLVGTASARSVGVVVATGTAIEAVTVTSLAVTSVATGRTVSVPIPLVIAGAVMLVVGQLWMVAILLGRGVRPANGRLRLNALRARFLFGDDLPTAVVIVVHVVAVAGFLLAASAALAIGDGPPSGSGQDPALWQRMWAGMLAFLFATQTGVGLGALYTSGTAGPPTTD